MDRGALWATVHGVAKNWTQLSNSEYLSCELIRQGWMTVQRSWAPSYLVVQPYWQKRLFK